MLIQLKLCHKISMAGMTKSEDLNLRKSNEKYSMVGMNTEWKDILVDTGKEDESRSTITNYGKLVDPSARDWRQ